MDAVIFDVDGTLADVSGIRHYVTADLSRKNFDKFHAAASFAPANIEVLDLARSTHEAGVAVVVVTARRERWRYSTATWLRKYDVPFDHLLMRADHDDRRDVDVKRDLLGRIRSRYDVVLAVDDNPAVIELWESEGIPVRLVPGWDSTPDPAS